MSLFGKHDPLLPCPTCGGTDVTMWQVGYDEDTCYYVECLDCSTRTKKIYQGPQEAATAWNRGMVKS